ILIDRFNIFLFFLQEEDGIRNRNVTGVQTCALPIYIMMMNDNTTGDGLLSGVHLAAIVKQSGKTLGELASQVETFPQKLVNVKVTDKHNVVNNEKVAAKISEVETEMDGNGRILVRASGTE